MSVFGFVCFSVFFFLFFPCLESQGCLLIPRFCFLSWCSSYFYVSCCLTFVVVVVVVFWLLLQVLLSYVCCCCYCFYCCCCVLAAFVAFAVLLFVLFVLLLFFFPIMVHSSDCSIRFVERESFVYCSCWAARRCHKTLVLAILHLLSMYFFLTMCFSWSISKGL